MNYMANIKCAKERTGKMHTFLKLKGANGCALFIFKNE
jgi:hypothetical protein